MLIYAHVGSMHQLHDFAHGAPGNNAQLPPGFQCFFRNTLGKGNFSFNLRIGPLEFFIQIHGDFICFTPFGFNADGRCNFFKLYGVLDGILFDISFHDLSEKIEHAHSMIGMGRTSGSHHAAEISSHDGVNGGATNTDFSIRIFGIQAAGPHGAVLATCGISTNGTSFHVGSSVKGCFYPVSFCFVKHLYRGVTNADILRIDLFFL